MEELTPAPSGHEPESIDVALARWVIHAHPRALLLMSVLGLGGSIAVLLLDWRKWAFAGLLLTASAVGGWGLVQHRAARPHSRAVVITEHLLAALACLIGFFGVVGLLLGLLGQAPNH